MVGKSLGSSYEFRNTFAQLAEIPMKIETHEDKLLSVRQYRGLARVNSAALSPSHLLSKLPL